MQGTYAAIFNMPLGPWLEIDNTAVIGSFLLGLYLFYPAYWLSYVAFSWQQARVQAATAPVPTSDTTFIVTGTDGRRAA
jgi:hypothetical protein